MPSAATPQGGLWISTITYSQSGPPAWAEPGSTIPNDLTHHLVVLAVKGSRAAVCSSDTSIYPALVRATAGVFSPVDRISMESAFVGNQARAIWMNGVHAPTAVKPIAKTLMGSALEYAIDPLGDQSFHYSAMRSVVTINQSGQSTHRVVGVSPANARVWIGRPKDWNDFVSQLESVIDHASGTHSRTVVYDALAQAVSDFTAVTNPYAVAVVPPELLSENDVTDDKRQTAVAWAYDATLCNVRGGPTRVVMDVTFSGLPLGELTITIIPQADRHDLVGQWTAPSINPNLVLATKQDEARLDGLEHLIERGWISIYYESGHTLTQRHLFLPRFRDAPFPWAPPLDFTGYNVAAEKPEHDKAKPLVSCIAAFDKNGNRDVSLFAYVVEKMFKDRNGNSYGWLASDDGSMEFADFIHIDTVDQVVTLVHVKAASSNLPTREVSVSAYEVVVGQAIKNLRHLDHHNLADALNKGQHKKISRAVWYNGLRMINRKGIIQAARQLQPDYKRRLIVLQPQLTVNERTMCEKGSVPPGRIERLKLLSTLLNGARASAISVSADFECAVSL